MYFYSRSLATSSHLKSLGHKKSILCMILVASSPLTTATWVVVLPAYQRRNFRRADRSEFSLFFFQFKLLARSGRATNPCQHASSTDDHHSYLIQCGKCVHTSSDCLMSAGRGGGRKIKEKGLQAIREATQTHVRGRVQQHSHAVL